MKHFFTLILAIFLANNLMAINVWDGSSEPWTNGSGTQNDPYLIETAANLAYLAEKVNEGYEAEGMMVFRYTYFLMTDDLDLNNIDWTPIGNADINLNGFYFAGVFDGWYHSIDHLKITSSADACGLFAGLGGEWDGTFADSYGQIKHLAVTNANIVSTGMAAGGIVAGIGGNGVVLQCSFSGTITVNNNGAFCGAGGIAAGAGEGAVIKECSSSGSIIVTNNAMGYTNAAGAGGIVGIAMNQASIESCYNTGSVTANALVMSVAAGIVGATLQDNEVSIMNSYNVGTVNATTKGGIFGMVSPLNPFKGETALSVTNCYYLNTCGGNTSYGTAMTSDGMKTEAFEDILDDYRHDYVMDNGTNNGYPIHSLVAYTIWDAAEVTDHSARLSADLHEGNEHFMEVKFIYYDMEDGAINEMYHVVVDAEPHVELAIEDLVPNTEYGYMLSVKFDDGITRLTSPRYFTTGDTDAVSSANAPEVLVYPNPATDVVYIQGVEATEIQVFNTLGQLVKTVRGKNEINISDLVSGVYLLKISDNHNLIRINIVR